MTVYSFHIFDRHSTTLRPPSPSYPVRASILT